MNDLAQVLGIIFDLDGVLFDSEPLWDESITATFNHFYNIIPSLDIAQTIKVRSNPTILAALIEKYYPQYGSLQEEVERANAYLEEHFITYMTSRIKFFPETQNVLEKLHELGISLSVASNAPKKVVSEIVTKNQFLRTHVHPIFTIDDVTNGKPNPEMLFKAMRILRIEPKNMLFVGDSLSTDGEASRAAGIPFVLLDRNNFTKGKAIDYFYIKSLTEILDLISSQILEETATGFQNG